VKIKRKKMSVELIVRWPTVSHDGDVLKGVRWHFIESERSLVMRCGGALTEGSGKYHVTELEMDNFHELTGFCFSCFQEICIIEQNNRLWEIFMRHQKVRESLVELANLIEASNKSAESKTVARGLLVDLLANQVIDDIVGGAGTMEI